MSISAIDLVFAVFATFNILDIWQKSELLAMWRARTELWTGFFGDLLKCRMCLGVWVSMIVSVILLLTPSPVPAWSQIGHGFSLLVAILLIPAPISVAIFGANFLLSLQNRKFKLVRADIFGILSIVFGVVTSVALVYLWTAINYGPAWWGLWFWVVAPAKALVMALAVAKISEIAYMLIMAFENRRSANPLTFISSEPLSKSTFEVTVDNKPAGFSLPTDVYGATNEPTTVADPTDKLDTPDQPKANV